VASIIRRIRRTLASKRGTDTLNAYAARKINAVQRDAALLVVTPPPRRFSDAVWREAREFVRRQKVLAGLYGRT